LDFLAIKSAQPLSFATLSATITMSKTYNFFSGPAILPEAVIAKAAEAIINFEGTGLSILEISHRSKEFVAVMENARALSKELLGLGDEYEVLFLQGGASLQFCMIPMNLLNPEDTAGYFDTGHWAHEAQEQAKLFGSIATICSSKKENYTHIPKANSWGEAGTALQYAHMTTNNTIYGTQWSKATLEELYKATAGTTLIGDMSSDIFCRPIDFDRFGMIYATVQKNVGPAGTTLIAVRKDILGKTGKALPAMLDYQTHIKKDSMHNTPSTYAVYVSYLTLQWIKERGLQQIERDNIAKATLLYDTIDSSKLFKGTAAREDRSLMNACFVFNENNSTEQIALLEKRFLQFAEERRLLGIAGHRSVGGFRASIYNAMPLAGVQALADALTDFEKTV
jgi:phosphoserine aminotransferase